jgi:Tfp pilus assembly protein PilF
VHPFGVKTLLAPLSLHSDVYPAHAELSVDSFHSRWLPLTGPEFWETLAVPPVAGLLIAAVALVTMLLNAGRLRWSHAVVWLAINGFAIAAGRELYAAAVVNVVLAALNGQDWYRATFREEYSVETGELIFSRGGRAVTVLALFALGFLAVSGRLMGPDVRRVGRIGFDDELAAQIDSYRDVLQDSLDDRPFNFRVEQGDVLIWIGQRPFIDSRLGLYAQGDPSLAERFRLIRLALRRPSDTEPDRGKPEVWQEAFEEFQVTHVVPRLTGADPDYGTFLELMGEPRWRLARLGAATAALYDYQSGEEGVADYLDEHQGADFIALAFQDVPEDDILLNQPVWPRQRTFYAELLSKRERPVSNDIQLARHYTTLLRGFRGAITHDQLTALAYLAIRHAWSGLAGHPNAVEGYMALAEAYGYLLDIHQIVQQGAGAPGGELLLANDTRQMQAALMKAVDCRPEDKQLHLVLARFLRDRQKLDLALEHMLAYERLNGSLAPVEADHPDYQTLLEQNQQEVLRLQDTVQKAREEVEIELLAGTSRLQAVGLAVSSGLPGEALRVLEEDATFVAQNPRARLMQAQLLMEVGRGEEAWTQLENMETAIRQNEPGLVNDWINSTAVANLTAGNFQRAVELWNEQSVQATMTQLRLALGLSAQPGKQPGLGMAPLVYAPPFVQDLKPILQARLFGDLLLSYPTRWDNSQLQMALALLQQGRAPEATETLSAVLEYDPETELRPPIAFYVAMLTGEPQSFVPPSDQIPITGDMFAPDEAAGEEPQPGPSGTDEEPVSDGSDPALPRPPPP